MDSENLENKILTLLLTEGPKRFEQLLNDLKTNKVIISRPTLVEKLKKLKERELIIKEGPRYGGLYKINKQTFDTSPLYPPVMAAVMAKGFKSAWYAMFTSVHEKMNNILKSEKIINNNTREELMAEITETAKKEIENLERAIGQTILETLVFQTETDLPLIQTINNLIHYLYIDVIKKDSTIRTVLQKNESYTISKKLFIKPYVEIEKSLLEQIKLDIEVTNLYKKVYGTESPMAKVDDDLYKEVERISGVPFFAMDDCTLGGSTFTNKENKKHKNTKLSKNP